MGALTTQKKDACRFTMVDARAMKIGLTRSKTVKDLVHLHFCKQMYVNNHLLLVNVVTTWRGIYRMGDAL